jgi:DNA-binding CsgD family transcriptional regulator
MTREVCPTCHQVIPGEPAHLTPRELDVLTAWWMTGSVTQAAAQVGLTEQRAKNLLAQARLRNRVRSNDQLFTMHSDSVRSVIEEQLSQNIREAAVA